MRIRFTPSARAALLETVVAMRLVDRARAAATVDRTRSQLEQLAHEPCAAPEMGPVGEAVVEAQNLRLYYRQRGEVLWVLAVWWGEAPNLPEIPIEPGGP